MGADVSRSNGRDALLQHFYAHSTICRPTSGKSATRSSFGEPGGAGMWAPWGRREKEKRRAGRLPSVAVSHGRLARLSAGPYAAPEERQQAGLLEETRGQGIRKQA